MRSFSSESSKHHKSQTIKAKELKIWKNVHTLQHVIHHMSYGKCHAPHVTCHVSQLIILKKNQTKLWSLSVEGLLPTGPTPSSFQNWCFVVVFILLVLHLNIATIENVAQRTSHRLSRCQKISLKSLSSSNKWRFVIISSLVTIWVFVLSQLWVF